MSKLTIADLKNRDIKPGIFVKKSSWEVGNDFSRLMMEVVKNLPTQRGRRSTRLLKHRQQIGYSDGEIEILCPRGKSQANEGYSIVVNSKGLIAYRDVVMTEDMLKSILDNGNAIVSYVKEVGNSLAECNDVKRSSDEYLERVYKNSDRTLSEAMVLMEEAGYSRNETVSAVLRTLKDLKWEE